MKKALIIGINGNFGSEMSKALLNRGWQLKVLLRDPAKKPHWLPESSSVIAGAAEDEQLVAEAAKNTDLIVYAANPPYHLWRQLAMKTLEPSVKAAEQYGIRLLFPGNVYAFAPSESPINENTPMQPPTDKGEIRQRMENRLLQASKQGAKVLIVRAGDFISPDSADTWFSRIIKKHRSGIKLALPHNSQHVHFWCYLPDLCTNSAELLDSPLPDLQVLHDPGLRLDKSDWLEACHRLGLPVKVSAFPWWFISLAALFSPLLREVNKMRYLWQQPVLLDGREWQKQQNGKLQHTPFDQILKRWLKDNSGR